MTQHTMKVIIVGAGPTGLLLALLLGQRGIAVDVLEVGNGIDQRPRGLAYGPAAVQVLRRANILNDIRQRTFEVETMAWRNLAGEPLIEIDFGKAASHPDRVVLFPVHELVQMITTHLDTQPTVSVHYGHEVMDVDQDERGACVTTRSHGEVKRIKGDFVVGCDGAHSIVRRTLYGASFPGHTWGQPVVVVNLRYSVAKFGWSDIQWIIDPNHWGMICKLSEDTCRVAYGEVAGLSEEEMRGRAAERLEMILPGNPKPNDYDILRFSPFIMHQRCVEKMRVGRVMLVGDAAHLCNPMGGLGLTSGIADVGGLVDCLYGINDGKATFNILDKWDELSRQKYHTMVDPVSSVNLCRIQNSPETAMDTDPFLKKMKEASQDEAFFRTQLENDLKMNSDMTAYYTNEPMISVK